MNGQKWVWRNESLRFLGEHALWREQERQLMVADLHLGKAEVFQAHGIPLPTDGDRGTVNSPVSYTHLRAHETG